MYIMNCAIMAILIIVSLLLAAINLAPTCSRVPWCQIMSQGTTFMLRQNCWVLVHALHLTSSMIFRQKQSTSI